MSRQNVRQNNSQSQNQNNYQNQTHGQGQGQSSNQLVIPVAARRSLDALKKARAMRSEFLNMESGTIYTLQFDPSKAHVEEKTFNGQTTQRISHSVIDVNDREAGEKTLSLTFKQSKPVEEAMEEGYTVMEVTKLGEGFSLTYQINPIE